MWFIRHLHSVHGNVSCVFVCIGNRQWARQIVNRCRDERWKSTINSVNFLFFFVCSTCKCLSTHTIDWNGSHRQWIEWTNSQTKELWTAQSSSESRGWCAHVFDLRQCQNSTKSFACHKSVTIVWVQMYATMRWHVVATAKNEVKNVQLSPSNADPFFYHCRNYYVIRFTFYYVLMWPSSASTSHQLILGAVHKIELTRIRMRADGRENWFFIRPKRLKWCRKRFH